MTSILTGSTYGVFVHRHHRHPRDAGDAYFRYLYLHRVPIYIPSDNDNRKGDVS